MTYLVRNDVAWPIPEYHNIAERYRRNIYLPWDNWKVKELNIKLWKPEHFGNLRRGHHETTRDGIQVP